MLVLVRDNKLQIEAEAATGTNSVEVVLRPEPSTSLNFPETLLQTVMRTRQRVIIDDARRPNPFAEDAYVVRHRPRSVLCLPLLKQAKLIGLIYLENNLAPATFTPQRIAVLEMLASQAAISLENARLYAELIAENRERRKAEEALRASEASLAEAQRISHTGNWRWNVRTGAVQWSAQHYRHLRHRSRRRAAFLCRIFAARSPAGSPCAGTDDLAGGARNELIPARIPHCPARWVRQICAEHRSSRHRRRPARSNSSARPWISRNAGTPRKHCGAHRRNSRGCGDCRPWASLRAPSFTRSISRWRRS